jgi:hypothetical protein
MIRPLLYLVLSCAMLPTRKGRRLTMKRGASSKLTFFRRNVPNRMRISPRLRRNARRFYGGTLSLYRKCTRTSDWIFVSSGNTNSEVVKLVPSVHAGSSQR